LAVFLNKYRILVALIIRPKPGELWKQSTGQKNGVDAFGYYCAETKRIWMTSGAL